MTDPRISSVHAWEGLDSRGRPTVGCRVALSGGAEGRAYVPSGASTGSHEAVELRDGDPARHEGRGVLRAVHHVRNELAEAVSDLDATETEQIDAALEQADGTPDLRRLGANAVLAVSLATARAGAAARGLPLYRALSDGAPPRIPLPMVNILSGGAHAGDLIDLQDILVMPVGATSFAQAITWAARVRAAAAHRFAALGLPSALVADEGGLAAPLADNTAALDLVARAIDDAGLTGQVAVALDVAANRLAVPHGYALATENRRFSKDEWLGLIDRWSREVPLVSVEDPFAEDDWDSWQTAARTLPRGVQLLGDDLFVTDHERLRLGIERQCADAVLVKPNQAGTLTRASRVVRLARTAGVAVVVSARSGETEDDWLADLALAWGADQIKVGSTTRSERTAKWNRLLEIEADPKADADYAAEAGLPHLGASLRSHAPTAAR